MEQTASSNPYLTVALIAGVAVAFSFPWSYLLAVLARKLFNFWATWVSCFNAYWIATLLPIAVFAGLGVLLAISLIGGNLDWLQTRAPPLATLLLLLLVVGLGSFLAGGVIFGRMIMDGEGHRLGTGPGLALAAIQAVLGAAICMAYLGISGTFGA